MTENKGFSEARVGIEPTGKGFADLAQCHCKRMKLNGDECSPCTCGPVLGQLADANSEKLSSYAFNAYGGDAKLYNGIFDLERQLAEARAKYDRVADAINRAFDPDGCACINDLPGDNYTCTAHGILFDTAREKGGTA